MHNDSPIKLTLFGNMQVQRGDVLLTHFRHRKSLALLAYLVITGESHSRDSLAGLLWGEASGTNALGGLRKVLAELRDILGPYLLEKKRSVSFNHNLPFEADVLKFEQGITQTLKHPAEMLNTAGSEILAQAIDLYTNDFLDGFYIQRAPAFEDWVTLTRERLRLNVLDGLYLLSKAAYRQGEYPTAIHYTRRLLELEPCHEEAHRQLMSLLALTGQRDLAIQQYERCAEILANTYKLEPQEETTNLFERICQENIETTPGEKFRLPHPTTPLVGRHSELNALRSRISDPGCQILTILGSGGSGKTHLALGFAAKLLKEAQSPFPDGIVFIPLAALRSIDTLPSAIAHQLNFQFHKESALISQLSQHLAGQQMLLVLDNFEHLLNRTDTQSDLPNPHKYSAEIFREIFEHAPGVKILVTSRVRLNLTEECLFPLGGIAFPPDGPAAQSHLADSPAVQLFIQSAERINPDFHADRQTLVQVAKICRQIQGLPLGILLAAGWSNLLSPSEIASQLSAETGINLLETESEDFPARQRSLNAVLAYSWKLLPPAEQATLAALSIFRGSFDLSAAQQITGASLNSLRSLIDHSLLQRAQNNRYQIHELTRQFTRQKIKNQAAIQAKYLAYYAAHFPTWAAAIKSTHQLSTIQEIDREIDNLQAAWDIALTTQNTDFLDQAIESLCLYYSWQHRFSEGINACQQLINFFESAEGQKRTADSVSDMRLYAKALLWIGAFSPLTKAEQPLSQSLDILIKLRSSADTSQETYTAMAMAYHELGRAVSQSGKPDEAQEFLEECIQISEQLEEHWLTANALTCLSSQLWDQSKYELSKKHIERGLALQKAIGDRRGMASSLIWLGMNSIFLGESQGEQYIRESLALHSELGEYNRMIDGVQLAAVALMASGRYEEACSLTQEIGEIDSSLILRQESIQSLLAAANTHLGNYDEARPAAEIGLDQSKRYGNPYSKGFARISSGWLALAEGENQYALDLFSESCQICLEHQLKDLYIWAMSFKALSAYQLGNFSMAQENFQTAFQAAVEIESYVGILFTVTAGLPLIADFAGESIALEIYTAMQQFPIFANSILFDQLVGQQIKSFEHTLPSETVEQIKQSGKNLTFEDLITKISNIPIIA